MRVIKTNSERGPFHSGQEFIRGVNDNIENLHTNSEILAGLFGELGDEFKLWAEVIITPPSEQDKIRYENFIMGYIYGHDRQPGETDDHSVYFKWDQRQGSLLGRVFMSPLLVAHVSTLEPAPAKSLVVDAAADATDPPPSTTPPPPLNGVSSNA